MSVSTTDPIRKVEFELSVNQLSEACEGAVSVPSVGFDFGSVFVRAAIVRRISNDKDEEKINVCLVTFLKTDAIAALRYAQAATSADKDVKVFYTGRATEQHLEQLQQTFLTTSIVRRDKLHCHAKGARFLISLDLPDSLLYHDSAEAQATLAKLIKVYEQFMLFMPSKMKEIFANFSESAIARNGAKFPLTLSIIGSNNIICSLFQDSSFKVIDARCIGGLAMETLWHHSKPPACPGDFDSFLQLAANGNRRGVDCCTHEVAEAVGFYSAMPPDYPIFSFGKLEYLSRYEVKPEDLARGLLGWHTDMIMMKTTDFAMLDKAYPIYFTGALVQNEFVRTELLLRNNLAAFNGMTVPQFFKTDATAALGACFDH